MEANNGTPALIQHVGFSVFFECIFLLCFRIPGCKEIEQDMND